MFRETVRYCKEIVKYFFEHDNNAFIHEACPFEAMASGMKPRGGGGYSLTFNTISISYRLRC